MTLHSKEGQRCMAALSTSLKICRRCIVDDYAAKPNAHPRIALIVTQSLSAV
jgi:hypothetical protein